jgi:hypothetical protein
VLSPLLCVDLPLFSLFPDLRVLVVRAAQIFSVAVLVGNHLIAVWQRRQNDVPSFETRHLCPRLEQMKFLRK